MIKKVYKNVSGLKGEIIIPADKSISHRAIMFSGIATGKSIIKNFSCGADPNSTLSIFEQLGVSIERLDKSTVIIDSDGVLKPPTTDLDCGNSGTTMRLMAGILAGQNFDSVLIGDESLSKRPMKRIIEPLTLMNADIESCDYTAPLKIHGKNLTGIDYKIPIASAQVKSSILLAGLFADGTTTVTEPSLSRNHTEIMLSHMGADITVDGLSVSIKPSKLKGCEINICGDISSAAYFIAAGLTLPKSDIILKNVCLNPTRTGILDVVSKMNGNFEILDKKIISGELTGDIRIKTSDLIGCEISGDLIPKLIDEIPVIAVMATQADGETIIKDAKDLRNKESDRITAVVTELRKLGAEIEELDDGMIIKGKTNLKGDALIETYNDHRLAMSMYVAGLLCNKEITIDGFEWAGISFPEFENLFNALIQ